MQERPDILWIVTTQWRAQACGYAGDPNAKTPRLDKLASESIDFTQAVTPHPFGPFARAALLTGVLSPENGIRDYFDPLPIDSRTVAHRLGEAGYTTAYFGKWHLASRSKDDPLVGEAHAKTPVPASSQGGFQFWEGFESGFLLNDPWLQGTRLPSPKRFQGYQPDVLCGRAKDWISEQLSVPEKRPFFCVVSLETPHPPYDAPAAGIPPSETSAISLASSVPRGGEVEARARRELAGYYAHIEATDRAIGRLIDAMPKQCVIVFTSVHGDMHGSHGLFRKGWPYEESIRVPLLVRLPAGVPQGGIKTAQLASLGDLIHWSCAWAGLEPENGCKAEGSRGAAECQEISMPSVVALPHQCDRAWRGVRTARQKLIMNSNGEPWLFFDLQSDPFETRNLVSNPASAPDIAALAALGRLKAL